MSDRDELAKQIHLSRNGGGSWVGEMDDDFDFIDAMNEADFVMASDWLARVKREAAAEALADAAVSIEPFSGIGLANGASRADVATWLRSRAAEYREQVPAETLIPAEDKQIRGKAR